MSHWLSLSVSEREPFEISPPKTKVFISVPKRVVKLATRRNRIKRLVREAVRKNSFFCDHQKVYLLRVLSFVPHLDLNQTDNAIRELIKDLK